MAERDAPRTIIGTYLVSTALFTLALSVIWSVNTLFLLAAGLSIFQVFLVNTAFTIGDLVFQVPTGVLADTLGRKVSFLLSIGTLVVSTLAYVAAAQYDLGIWAFALASVAIGLGFTFYSGALEAWLVDALDRVGYGRPKEQIFAWGSMVFSSAMLVGTLLGGLLGEIDLELPYVVRAAALVVTFVIVALAMDDSAFERKALTLRAFGERTRRIAATGLRVGWGNPAVRPLFYVSIVQGAFYIFGFYSWQPYFLDLLGRQAVWVTGVVASVFALAGICGNALVRPIMTPRNRPPRAAGRVLSTVAVLQALAIVAVGAVWFAPGAQGGGVVPFLLGASFYWVWGLAFGIIRPVRQAFLNRHIPSETRATILSVDVLFQDVGEAVGQPVLGYVSQVGSIALAWLFGGVVLFAAPALYARAGMAEAESEEAADA